VIATLRSIYPPNPKHSNSRQSVLTIRFLLSNSGEAGIIARDVRLPSMGLCNELVEITGWSFSSEARFG
jgi:hypothetical protein